MRHVRHVIRFSASVFVAFCLAGPAEGQQCDDFNACTANDMCSGGMCTGTPASSGSCDDFNECTVNDQCIDLGSGPFCMGDPATVGTECQGGCGTCESLVPIPLPGIPLTCVLKDGAAGNECQPVGLDDLGPCFDGRCMEFGIPGFAVAACIPQAVVCPDTDGNPCTDACNFENGQCQRIERPCGFPGCGRCDPATGNCVSDNEGSACDDFNVCTAQSRCQGGLCVEGVPTPGGDATATPTTAGENTPTPTGTAPQATPTIPVQATPTMPEGPVCVGDCNRDGRVMINESLTAVNIGLDILNLEACPAADANGNGVVAINEIILGVGNGLNDCPA